MNKVPEHHADIAIESSVLVSILTPPLFTEGLQNSAGGVS